MPSQKQYPFFLKGRFKNNRTEKSRFFFLSFFIYLYAYLRSCFERTENTSSSPASPSSFILARSENFIITPMGHATVLFNHPKISLISDPLFWSPSFCLKRHIPCSPSCDDLPLIDHILLSHTHRDHCDLPSLQALYKKNPHITAHVPLGAKNLIARSGIKNIYEYTWWQEVTISSTLKLIFLPAVHWSQHGLFDYNKALWGSWLIQTDKNQIYFGGDTAYSSHFKAINEHFPGIDCALLPIGPEEPASVMKKYHMNAEESIQAYEDLGRPFFIPIHWGVFKLGTDPVTTSLKKLQNLMEIKNYSMHLQGIEPGRPFILPHDLHKQIAPSFSKNKDL